MRPVPRYRCRGRVAVPCYHGHVAPVDWREDGTYQESSDTVLCDSCYVAIMDASPSGRGLADEILGTLQLLRERQRRGVA